MQKPPFRPKGQKRPANDDKQPDSSRDKLTAASTSAAYRSALDEAFRIIDEKLAGQDKLEPDMVAASFLANTLMRMIDRWGPEATAKAIEASPDMISQATQYLSKKSLRCIDRRRFPSMVEGVQ